MVGTRALALMLCIALVSTSCGGGSDSNAASGLLTAASAPADLSGVEGAGPLIDLLGEAIDVRIETVDVTIDERGGDLELSSGATLEVEPGAFAGDTMLTVSVVDLPFDEFATNPPEVRIYVLSTDVEIQPDPPVVLDVPAPPGDIAVSSFVDGEWVPVHVADGSSSRIEFDHFSDQVRSTVRLGTGTAVRPEAAFDPARLEAYAAAADEFRFCVSALASMARGFDPLFGPTPTLHEWENALLLELGLSTCAAALVQKLTPPGEFVTVACVGDHVDRGNSVLQAIDACIDADNEDGSATTTAVPEDQATASDGQATTEAAGTEPLVFDGQGLVINDQERVREGIVLSCETTTDLTLTLRLDGSAELLVANLPHVAPEACEVRSGQLHTGSWTTATDGTLIFEIESVGETATVEKISGTITDGVVTGGGGFTAHTVLGGEVRTRFIYRYEFVLNAVG